MGQKFTYEVVEEDEEGKAPLAEDSFAIALEPSNDQHLLLKVSNVTVTVDLKTMKSIDS